MDLDRGPARADHRRHRHGLWPAARRAGGQDAWRSHQARHRRRAGARSRHLRLRADSGRGVRAARHCGIAEVARMTQMLRVEDVSRRFGGLLAVDGASLAADAGCITALIGPNGAGKTTLFSIITGFCNPAMAAFSIKAPTSPASPPHRLARRGIARTSRSRSRCRLDRGREHCGRFAPRARQARGRAGCREGPWRRPSASARCSTSPPPASRSRGASGWELARALAIEPKLLLLDEVLAGLNPSEIRGMVPVIRAISDRGVTVLMIRARDAGRD